MSNRPLSQAFFEELLSSFLEKEGASKKTQKNYLSDVRAFLDFTKNNNKVPELTLEHIANLTPKDIENYIQSLTQNCSPSTGVRHLSSIRSLFRALHSSGLIANNPAENFAKSKQEKVKQPISQELTLIQWEMQRMKAGHRIDAISEDLSHVQEFLSWLEKNHV